MHQVVYSDKSCSSIFCHQVNFLLFHFDCLLSFLVGIAVFRRSCWPAEQRAFTRPHKSFTKFQIQDWILLKEKEDGRVGINSLLIVSFLPWLNSFVSAFWRSALVLIQKFTDKCASSIIDPFCWWFVSHSYQHKALLAFFLVFLTLSSNV